MDDTTQKNPGENQQQDAGATAIAQSADKKRFVSFGENAHKWGTYISIDWFLNYATGIAFAMWGKYSKIGQKYWTEPLTKVARSMSENVFRFKPGPGLESSVGNVIMILSVIAGGMFTIPPLMVLESKPVRKGIVKSLDQMYYGKDEVENDPKFAEAYEAMDHAPKQGFWTGLSSRLAALTPCIATVYFEKPKQLSKPYFDFIERNSERAYKAVGLNKDRLFKNLPEAEKEARWKFLHDNSAIDFGLEPWYAALHMVAYRGFAKIADMFKGPNSEQAKLVRPQPQHIVATTGSMTPEPIDVKQEKEKPGAQVSDVSHQMQLASAPQHALQAN